MASAARINDRGDFSFSFSTNISCLQKFLRDRGVSVSNQRKEELIALCKAADRLGIEVDPDGLFEDRSREVASKLTVSVRRGDRDEKVNLTLPTLMMTTKNLSALPEMTEFDVLLHLGKGHSYSEMRNHRKLEGFLMFRDGFVLDLQTCKYGTQHSAILAQVKPRTNSKDPTTGLPYYICWIILSSMDEDERIHSAFCSCRGGIDGYCRHVAATLFEMMHFNDEHEKSCTSEPCIWNRRKTWTDQPIQPVEVTALQTSILRDKVNTQFQTVAENFCAQQTACPDRFFRNLADVVPKACGLNTVFKKQQDECALQVKTPLEKLLTFKKSHICSTSCNCSIEFLKDLTYLPTEKKHIEQATRGQSRNVNWHVMRKGLLTASTYKSICHSTDFTRTANALQNKKSFNEFHLPAPIEYGKHNENKARRLFMQDHQVYHKNCSIEVSGLLISEESPFLGCSPDGIVSCSCGEFIIEIKCLWKYKSFHPKVAGKMSGLIVEDQEGNVKIESKHAYHYQIQGQMAVANIDKAMLVIFTNKGIFSLAVPFNKVMWGQMKHKLHTFYHDIFFPSLMSQC